MKQKGFILIVSLIFMAIMSMLAIYMFSGFTTDEMLSGNHREKTRATEAAQTAQNYANYWLSQQSYTGNFPLGQPCSGVSTTIICSNALINPTNPQSWTSYTSFTPSGMVVNAAGGIGTYAAIPQYYIYYMGLAPSSTNSYMYQVTSAARGGNATATSVIQAVYQVTSTSVSLDTP